MGYFLNVKAESITRQLSFLRDFRYPPVYDVPVFPAHGRDPQLMDKWFPMVVLDGYDLCIEVVETVGLLAEIKGHFE